MQCVSCVPVPCILPSMLSCDILMPLCMCHVSSLNTVITCQTVMQLCSFAASHVTMCYTSSAVPSVCCSSCVMCPVLPCHAGCCHVSAAAHWLVQPLQPGGGWRCTPRQHEAAPSQPRPASVRLLCSHGGLDNYKVSSETAAAAPVLHCPAPWRDDS